MQKLARSPAIFLICLAGPMLAAPATGAAQQIPDFSGGWDRMGTLVETYEAIPGYSGAGPLLVDPRHPHVNGSSDLTWAHLFGRAAFGQSGAHLVRRIRRAL
jgi:hypothetical protein